MKLGLRNGLTDMIVLNTHECLPHPVVCFMSMYDFYSVLPWTMEWKGWQCEPKEKKIAPGERSSCFMRVTPQVCS